MRYGILFPVYLSLEHGFVSAQQSILSHGIFYHFPVLINKWVWSLSSICFNVVNLWLGESVINLSLTVKLFAFCITCCCCWIHIPLGIDVGSLIKNSCKNVPFEWYKSCFWDTFHSVATPFLKQLFHSFPLLMRIWTLTSLPLAGKSENLITKKETLNVSLIASACEESLKTGQPVMLKLT